jgi:hypothetical protein
MDFNKSYIKAQKNVMLKYSDSDISSDECTLFNKSRNLNCHGKVKVNINFDGF